MSPIKTRSQSVERNKPTKSMNKRLLSPELKSKNDNTKKHKQSAMTSQDINDIKSLIEASRINISEQIQQSQNNLETKFNELAAKVNVDVTSLKNTVEEFKTKVTSEFDNIKSQLSEHTQRIDNTDDDIQRVKLFGDLRVTGFPAKDGENLRETFDKIAKEIGYIVTAETAIPTIQRMPMKNKANGVIVPSITIMFHFSTPRQKQIFYSYYLGKMPLDPTKFGLSADNRITIGESLTRKNAQIFKKAQTYKKNGKISQTFTEDGLVKIRFKKGKGEPTLLIRNETALELYIAQNEVTSTTNMQHVINNTTEHAQNGTTAHSTAAITTNINGQGNLDMITNE